MNFFKEITKKIENSKQPVIYFLLATFSIISVRNFLEFFSSTPSFQANPSPMIRCFPHNYAFYGATISTFIIIFYLATKEKIKKIAKLVLAGSCITILPPIIDLITSRGRGHIMTYIAPESSKNLWEMLVFLTAAPFQQPGITPGIRCEIVIGLSACFAYFLIKNKSIARSFLFTCLIYYTPLVYGSAPYLSSLLLEKMNMPCFPSCVFMRNFFLLLILILMPVIFYLEKKKLFLVIVDNIKPFRFLHFAIMPLVGILLGDISTSFIVTLSQEDLFFWPFISASIAYVLLFSAIINDLADYKIDKISNRKRPLISKSIPSSTYKKIGFISLVIAIFCAAAINIEFLLLIALVTAGYFIYSMPPLRLKKVPLLSKIIISLNSLSLLTAGFFFTTGTLSLPGEIVFFFLIFLTLSSNFIDIKDYEGDKRNGIRTLPVILGLEKSKKVIGIFFIISYLSLGFLLKDLPAFPFLVVAGLLHFLILNKKEYQESLVFGFYLADLVVLIFYLVFKYYLLSF